MWILSSQYKAAGLALGFSLGSFFEVVLLAAAFRWKMRQRGAGILWLDGERLIGAMGLKAFSAAIMAAVTAYSTFHFLISPALNVGLGGLLMALTGASGAGVIIYFLAAKLFKLEEASVIWLNVAQKLKLKHG